MLRYGRVDKRCLMSDKAHSENFNVLMLKIPGEIRSKSEDKTFNVCETVLTKSRTLS